MAERPPSSPSDPITRLRALGRDAVRAVLAAFRRSSEDWGFDLAAVALCVVAASAAFRKAHDLEWPGENDLFRDMAAAQSILDGNLGADPSYLGERAWYNPLVPALVGLASRATSLTLHEGYATLGVTLNLLGPVALYVLGVSLFGRRGALAALVGFLFLGPLELLSWLAATYSPWLWSQNFAQGLFYLSLVLWLMALERRSVRFGVAAGVGLGLTALAHTAPALILACIVCVSALTGAVGKRGDRAAVKNVLALLACVTVISVVVSAPFWSSLIHYRGEIKNRVPLEWLASEFRIAAWKEEFWHLPSLRGTLALVGGLGLFLPGTLRPSARSALFTWGAVTALGIAYGYAAQRFQLRSLLPSWHFHFYLRALESVLFGLGVLVLLRGALWGAARVRTGSVIAPEAIERGVYGFVVLALVALCLTRTRAYRTRFDLTFNRSEAQRFTKLPTTKLYAWVLAKTKPEDVFLADGDAGFRAVMPSGRKLVALPDLFSNPYVDQQARARDQSSMYQSLEEGRWDDFFRVARTYHVRYVTLPAAKRRRYHRSTPILHRVYTSRSSDGFDAYRVLDGGGPAEKR